MTDATPTEIQTAGAAAAEIPQPTAPENISISLRGFDTEEHAHAFGNLVATYVRSLSRYIDGDIILDVPKPLTYGCGIRGSRHEVSSFR
jgi:hypothetical protein